MFKNCGQKPKSAGEFSLSFVKYGKSYFNLERRILKDSGTTIYCVINII